jgi:hypothetical protein
MIRGILVLYEWWPQQVSVGKNDDDDDDDDDGGGGGGDNKDEDAETAEMHVFFCTYVSKFLQ